MKKLILINNPIKICKRTAFTKTMCIVTYNYVILQELQGSRRNIITLLMHPCELHIGKYNNVERLINKISSNPDNWKGVAEHSRKMINNHPNLTDVKKYA